MTFYVIYPRENHSTANASQPPNEQRYWATPPFLQAWVTIYKEKHITLIHQACLWGVQRHAGIVSRKRRGVMISPRALVRCELSFTAWGSNVGYEYGPAIRNMPQNLLRTQIQKLTAVALCVATHNAPQRSVRLSKRKNKLRHEFSFPDWLKTLLRE